MIKKDWEVWRKGRMRREKEEGSGRGSYMGDDLGSYRGKCPLNLGKFQSAPPKRMASNNF